MATTKTRFHIGSISTGTLLTSDLIEAFSSELERLAPSNPLLMEVSKLLGTGDGLAGLDRQLVEVHRLLLGGRDRSRPYGGTGAPTASSRVVVAGRGRPHGGTACASR